METTKIRGGCMMPGELHRILIVTLDQKLIKLWEESPLAEITFLNGWKVKKWEGGFEVIGQYCPAGWVIRKGQFILSQEKCLELWVPSELPLAKELISSQFRKVFPRVCPECLHKELFLKNI